MHLLEKPFELCTNTEKKGGLQMNKPTVFTQVPTISQLRKLQGRSELQLLL